MNPWGLLTKPLYDRPGLLRRKEAPPHPRIAMKVIAPLTLVHPSPPPDKIKPQLVQQVRDEFPNDPWGLTDRQAQVLDLAVQGMERAEIASQLGISLSTTSQHLAEVRSKMKVDTTPQAVVCWHRYHRVVGPKPADCDKDDLLIANLTRATALLRATKAAA